MIRALFILFSFFLSGCVNTATYSVLKTPGYLHDWPLRDVATRIRDGAPDEVRIISDREKHLIFYSGKTLFSGQKSTAIPDGKEQYVVVVRDGKRVEQYRTIQVIDLYSWNCGNVMSHGAGGNLCGSHEMRTCEDWGKSTTSACPSEIEKQFWESRRK